MNSLRSPAKVEGLASEVIERKTLGYRCIIELLGKAFNFEFTTHVRYFKASPGQDGAPFPAQQGSTNFKSALKIIFALLIFAMSGQWSSE